jgi:hypothetical protein
MIRFAWILDANPPSHRQRAQTKPDQRPAAVELRRQAVIWAPLTVIGGVEQKAHFLHWICPTATHALCVLILQRSPRPGLMAMKLSLIK